MAKKKSSHSKPTGLKHMKPLPAWAHYELASAVQAIDKSNWLTARQALEALDARCPRRPEILALLSLVCSEQEDFDRLMTVGRQISQLTPDDPDAQLLLAQAYLANDYPVLALQAMNRLASLQPKLAEDLENRALLQEIQDLAEVLLEGTGLSLDDMQSAVLHEELNLLMAEDRLKEAREVAHLLLERMPHFSPALNNLSQLEWVANRPEAAITTAERVLVHTPDNVHALSNLVRYCLLSGREADAKDWAKRLIACDSPGYDVTFKKLEALSYLGDDNAIIDTYEKSQTKGLQQSPGTDAASAHLAAVAMSRLGRDDEARRLWDDWADDLDNRLFVEAEENRADIEMPVGNRSGAWPFSFQNWIPQPVVDKLLKKLDALGAFADDDRPETAAMRRTNQKFLAENPALESLIPVLLDRGDSATRKVALMLAAGARTPACLAALSAFALGQRGTDEDRFRAAQIASEEGALSLDENGMSRLWQAGEWRDVLLLTFEFHDEPSKGLSRSEAKIFDEAYEAQGDGDFERAESLFRELLAKHPNEPSLRFNVSQTLLFQGLSAEADAVLRETHAQHPDYLPAAANMAMNAIDEGDIETAEALLKPFLQSRRMTQYDCTVLMLAQIHLLLAKGKPEIAASWLVLFEDIDPEHLVLPVLEMRIAEAKGSEI